MERMEKLIELLNEYDRIKGDKEEPIYNWKIAIKTKLYKAYLISSNYGFIEWLVENEKIHREKIPAVIKVDGYLADGSDTEYYNMEESLLMQLSISNSPVEDLILYLK